MNEQDTKQALQRMRAAQFVRNNGRVLACINILRDKFVPLVDAQYALEGVDKRRFLDSVNYLSESGYIQLRTIAGKVAANLADEEFDKLEAKLTAKGIRLTTGNLIDELVDV